MVKQAYWVIIAAILAFLSICFGAFAAHGLKNILSADQLNVIETAARYQMYHALAILVTTALFTNNIINTKDGKALNYTNALFVLGVILFSGSLYALVFSGIKSFALITPLGGFLLLLAWISLIYTAFRSLRPNKSSKAQDKAL